MTTKTLSIRLAIILLLLLPLSLLTGKTWAANTSKNSWFHVLQTVILTLALAGIALPAWTVKVNFYIIAMDGTRAMTLNNVNATVDAELINTLPDDYKSPFLDNSAYKFYTTLEDAQAFSESNVITKVSSTETNIYVAYRYDMATYLGRLKGLGFALVGTYQIKTARNKERNDQVLYYQGNFDDKNARNANVYSNYNYVMESNLAKATDETVRNMRIRHALNLIDPYKVYIQTHFEGGYRCTEWSDSKYTESTNNEKQQRDGWYLSIKNNKNPSDLRAVESLDMLETRLIQTYAILKGHDNSGGSDDTGLYRIAVANNLSGNASSLDKAYGHYYLNNTENLKTSFQRRKGNDDIRLYANHTMALQQYRFDFKVKTPLTGTWLTAYQFLNSYEALNTTITLPTKLERKYAYNHKFYTDEACTTEVTNYKNAYDAGYTTFYVKYDVENSETKGFNFSTYDNIEWYQMKVKNGGSDDNIYFKAARTFIKGTPSEIEDLNEYWFAFIGDPYELQVVNYKASSPSFKSYLGIGASETAGTRMNSLSGANDKTWWQLVDDANGNSGYFNLQQFYPHVYDLPALKFYYYPKDAGTNQLVVDKKDGGVASIKLEKILGSPKCYLIVDNSGEIALRATAENVLKAQTPIETMPDILKSPAVTIYRFYNTLANAQTDNGTTGIITKMGDTTTEIDGIKCVYVRYTADANAAINLTDKQPYYVSINGREMYVDHANGDAVKTLPSVKEVTLDHSVWLLDAVRESKADPYDIRLHVTAEGISAKGLAAAVPALNANESMSLNNTYTHFALLYGKGEGQYTLAAAAGNSVTDGHLPYLGLDGEDAKLMRNSSYAPQETDAIQIQLNPFERACVYHIIDNSGDEAISMLSTTKAYPFSVPDPIRSPLASDWRYYFDVSKAQTDALEGKSAVATHQKTSYNVNEFLTGTGNLELYVRYTYDVETSAVKLNAEYMQSTPPYYSLEFTDTSSPEIYMESDNLPTDKMERPSYLYVNGFGQFYLYGHDSHEDIFGGGKSSRTRFLWYFVGNDPYNVNVMSYQKVNSKNTYLKTDYDNSTDMFLRTYYDEGIDRVVTALTQKQKEGLMDGPENTPSNYMILGKTDAFEFVTREQFSGTNLTLEEFEHGWRYAGERSNTGDIEAIFAEKDMNAHHLDFDPDHWFVTVQMGRTFKINEEELTPVLVLLDRHGWRLKYWNFSQKNDAAIKLFNSPLVTKYKWYNFSKTVLLGEVGDPTAIWKSEGFYRYMMPEDAELNVETTELSYAAWKAKGGSVANNNVNIFVTYEVDGAEEWTDNVAGPDWLINQNGTLGYLNGEERLVLGDPADEKNLWSHYDDSPYVKNFSDLTTAQIWQLERNTQIDEEMGYEEEAYKDKYNGIYFTYEDEQQLFDPYNLRIKSKTGTEERPIYLTTAYMDDELQYEVTTTSDPSIVQTTIYEEDVYRQVTGATWMYVQDKDGAPRLMPRFEKNYSLTELSTVERTEGSDAQKTQLIPIKEYTTIHIREKEAEAGTPDDLTEENVYAIPGQTIKLKDDWKRYWCEYEYYDKYAGSAYDENNKIETFSYISDVVWAPYTLSDNAPRFSKNAAETWWYDMGIENSPKYAQSTDGPSVTAEATATDETNDYWLWGFVGNPYSFKIVNRNKNYLDNNYLDTDATFGTGTDADWTAPVGLSAPYFKLKDANSYMAISNGNLTVRAVSPTVEANKITLVSQNKATFKIINNAGGLALDFKAELPREGLALPEFVRSPLVDKTADGYRDGYKFSTNATLNDGIYTFDDGQKKELTYRPVHGETIYVRYAFNNNTSLIDLDGRARFNMKNGGTYLFQQDSSGENAGNWKSLDDTSSDLGGKTYRWRFKGLDPYNIKITNDNVENSFLGTKTTDKLSSSENTNVRLNADGTETALKSFILVYGSEDEKYQNCYRFLAAYPHKATDGTEDDGRGSDSGIFWYFGRRIDSSENYGGFTASDMSTEEKRKEYTNIELIPRDIVNVVFRLQRQVTDEWMVSPAVEAACKTDVKLPEGWLRKYCSYKYYCRYNANESTPYSTGYPEVEIKQVPFIPSGDGDEVPEIEIRVEYEVDDDKLPFNLIPTLTNKKAEIENLPESIFKLDTYEDRLERGFGSTKTESDPKGYLYFLVMNTNDAFSSGKQYFLQRDETTGRISYLSNSTTNDYDPKVNPTKNVNGWSYSRVAESYRATDHSLFREGSWLWAFAGDPYDLYVFNVEGVIQQEKDVFDEKATITPHPRHALGYKTLSKTTKDKNGVETTTYEYVPNTIDYSESDTEFSGYRWGMGFPTGANSSSAFSLQVNEQENGQGWFVPDGTEHTRYWHMAKSGVESVNEVLLDTRADNYKGTEYNLKVLPYEPTRYEDVNLVIRRKDNIFIDMADVGANGINGIKTFDDLVTQTSGLSELYYAASTRQFAKDDVIKSSIESLPLEARRQFCDYTIYTDVYNYKGDYTVQAGPYVDDKNRVFTYVGNVKKYIKEDGSQTDDASQAYQPTDGKAKPGVWPQNLYVSYVVTTDAFLAKHPDKATVTNMVNNNDHVFFMDFTQNKAEGYDKGRHAYYDDKTYFTKDEKTHLNIVGGKAEEVEVKDKNGNTVYKDGEPVKTVNQVTDTDVKYNRKHFNSTGNRMETVPENLKWYFVGDPYKLQVYCTKGEWRDVTDGKTAANLCRFDPTESRFQYIVDCVHLRVPDPSLKDPREWLVYFEDNATTLTSTGRVVKNPYYNQPFYDDFYWEVVPTVKGTGAAGKDYFALRFKRDNVQLKYKDVYYYLAGADKSKTYVEGTYKVNLSYYGDNRRQQTGNNKGMHTANDQDCIIKLVQPAKVYFSAYKPADKDIEDYSYPSAERVTNEELSEYFGVGETLSEVPRHLQRKFVKYGLMTNTKNNVSAAKQTLDSDFSVASNLEDCTTHPGDETGEDELTYHRITAETVTVTDEEGGSSEVRQLNKLTRRASYKFNINYRTEDLSSGANSDVNMFTTEEQYLAGKIQWLDFAVAGTNWAYYDKLNSNDYQVSNYRIAMEDNTADGWNDGLKGLHWAFVGDPYDFKILNRRRYETGSNQWLVGVKETIGNWQYKDDSPTENKDSVIWYTKLASETTTTNTSKATAALADGNTNSHWSLQMWKTGTSSDYFLRTASLKTTTVDNIVGDYANDYNVGGEINQTNNYWRIVAKAYTAADGTQSFFEMVPYSLADRSSYTTNTNSYSENFSKTMKDLGVSQQRTEVRTAVAKDHDRADNDCFDADIRIYTNNGDLRISRDNMELRYDVPAESLPVALQRYGCKYRCYLDYNPVTGEGILIENFDDDTPLKDGKTFRELVQQAKEEGKRLTMNYVYTYSDVADFFTTPQDATTQEYTWMNTYFNWMQKYSGINVEVERYTPIFDHYVYNGDGHIVDEVYRYERTTEYTSNPDQLYETKGFVNTHTDQEPVYADEGAQSENDNQKWALVGDPYAFTMKNYAQYLKNIDATVMLDEEQMTTTNSAGMAQNFALALDKDGKVYLGVVDENYVITKYMSFEFSASSDKHIYTVGKGENTKDPTGNTINTGGAKQFALSNLLRYADILQYHLVIAHRNSMTGDHNTLTTEQEATIEQYMSDFLKYQGLLGRKNSTDDEKRALLREHGTLRDLISFPIADYDVSRVGIGNRPQVPWYMKRQFCNYTCYQQDVMRSITLNGKNGTEESFAYELADQAWIDARKSTYTDPETGKIYKVDPTHVDHDPSATGRNRIKLVFYEEDENGIPQKKYAYNIKWVSIQDISYWDVCDASDTRSHKVTADEAEKWKNGLVANTYRTIPRGYDQAMGLMDQPIDKLLDCHFNRKIIVYVVYDVNTDEFEFARDGRNSTEWYQMMTNNDRDGLMNFSYSKGVGAMTDRAEHYTNDYLWSPEGDPYGFVLRSRYATINGTGWNDVAVTTTAPLPAKKDDPEPAEDAPGLKATYTGSANASSTTPFDSKDIVHTKAVAGAVNAVYEMFTGDYKNSFLMHPTSAWIDISDTEFRSYYMTHDTGDNTTKLVHGAANTLRTNADANWRLANTPEQLWPYFKRAGYVGGVDPDKASNYVYQEIYDQLDKHSSQPEYTVDYSVLKQARKLVYKGKFYKSDGKTEVDYDDARPTGSDLPLHFVAENLVNMAPGYYRIQGFSTTKLNAAETATGIQGPRYVSGYRFKSEQEGSKPLHFFETDMANAKIHTFGDLTTAKSFSDGILQGNIELLPADSDPSSIFQFKKVTDNSVERYTLSTQGLNVQGTVGSDAAMSADGSKFRLEDIGGAAVTLRLLSTGPTENKWDNDVATTLQTNYLTSGGDSYKLSVAADNEMNQTETTEIQDTKWLLQPVGVHEEWPSNQMPLRVEVQKGGVKSQELTGDELTAEENKDKYYYGTLFVPYDTRLASTVDAAFTMITEPSLAGGKGKVTLASVSQYNDMGNPQYVPAEWPVVLRTDAPVTVQMKNQDNSDYGSERYYVNLFLPFSTQHGVSRAPINGNLQGVYLEQQLSNSGLTKGPNASTTDPKVMVFGLPFAAPHDSHAYDSQKQVGFYTNENWARESNPKADARTATDVQRDNRYVYHNKIYYLHNMTSSAPVRQIHIVALFDGEDEVEFEEDRPIDETVGGENVPWPCDVYDLQGRRVAENETPQTLRKNHPRLRKGVYMFGGHKVVVR